MESKIIVKVTTKNLRRFSENEDGSGGDLTAFIEKNLHDSIKRTIEYFVDNHLEDSVLEHCNNVKIEGLGSFMDYGSVNITVE